MFTKDTALSEVKGTANKVKEFVRDTAHEICEDPACTAHKAGKQIRRALDSAEEEMRDTAAVVKREIRTKPIQSGLIAVGIGFLLGTLLRRR